MTGVWALAALWLGLALIASLLSIWLRVSTALSEIVVGTIAQLIIGAAIGSAGNDPVAHAGDGRIVARVPIGDPDQMRDVPRCRR